MDLDLDPLLLLLLLLLLVDEVAVVVWVVPPDADAAVDPDTLVLPQEVEHT